MQKNEKNKYIDLTEILKDYSEKWVVLTYDNKKVLKSSKNVEDLKDYYDKGILFFVPNQNFSFCP